MNECRIVEDLMPLYAEELISPETREFVDAHCAECEKCGKLRQRSMEPLEISKPNLEYGKNLKQSVWRIVIKTLIVSTIAVGIYLYFLWEFGFLDKKVYEAPDGNFRFEVVDCDSGFFPGGACIVTPMGQDINLYTSQTYHDFQVWYHPDSKGYFACITFSDRMDTWLCLSEYDEDLGMEMNKYYLSGEVGDRDFLHVLTESELGQAYLHHDNTVITFDRWSDNGNLLYFNYEVPGGYFGEIIYSCQTHEVLDITCMRLRPNISP